MDKKNAMQAIVEGSGIHTPIKTGHAPDARWKIDEVYGHKWIMNPVFTVSRREIFQAVMGVNTPLDAENIVIMPPPGCMVCELTYEFAKDHECPGEPKGYETDGTPIHYEGWIIEGKKKGER